MPAVRKAPVLKKPSKDDVEAMVISHERALFGYTDRDSLQVVPGLLARIDQAHRDIAALTGSVAVINEKIEGVPELVEDGKKVKRWGAYGTAVVIALLLAIIFHQYGLVTAVLSWFH